ncbi:MAG: hypothetical protein K8L97_26910 [Anaerolineae bacterium]|nr:hypothetical protein [Anaerolineae bacterium]
MIRRLSVISVLILSALILLIVPSRNVQASCTTISGSFDASPVTTTAFSAGAGDTITITMSHPGVQMSAELRQGLTTVAQVFNQTNSLSLSYTSPGNLTYDAFLSDNEGLPTGTTFYTITVGCADTGTRFAPDDRINPHAEAPVAIYCLDDALAIYAIGSDSKGTLALYLTADDLAEIADSPSANTVIASTKNIRLYRLASGELQVSVGPDAEGKDYGYIWSNCDPDSGTHYTA